MLHTGHTTHATHILHTYYTQDTIPGFVTEHKVGLVVTDYSPIRVTRTWRDGVAEKVPCLNVTEPSTLSLESGAGSLPKLYYLTLNPKSYPSHPVRHRFR